RFALQRANYLSVRDEVSKEYLLDVWPEAQIEVVPDTAWALSKLWSREDLFIARENFFSRLQTPPPERTIVLHLNRRYLSGNSLSVIAGVLDDVSQALDARPILIAFAPCHHDGILAREVGQLMASRPIVMDSPQSLQEVAACISLAEAYIGSSMHGLITASAFGVPGLSVASPDMAKFAGLSKLIGQENLIFENWLDAKERILALNFDQRVRDLNIVLPRIDHALNAHWKRVQTEIQQALPVYDSNTQQLKIGPFFDYQCEMADILLRINEGNNDLSRKMIKTEHKAQRKALEQDLMAHRRTLEQNFTLQRKGLDAEIKRLKAKVARIERSLSWRLTFPLRKASAK